MTDPNTPPTASNKPDTRRPKARKNSTTATRALLATLAVGATLGGWALVAKDAQSEAASVVEPSTESVADTTAEPLQLTPLPTVVAPPSDLDQIATEQLAPLTDNSSTLQLAPVPTTPRTTTQQPRARSRSSR